MIDPIGEKVLAAKLPAFQAAFPEWHVNLAPEMLADPHAGQWLWYFGLLSEMPELLQEEPVSANSFAWSRYYWFLRFSRLWQALYGQDAGLEQQANQILEAGFATGEPEWDEGRGIELMAERDVNSQLLTIRTTGGAV